MIMYQLMNVTKEYEFVVKDDPVRPELNYEFRTSSGREMFLLKEVEGELAAVICVGYTGDIPKSVNDLNELQSIQNNVAVFYTVWSYKRGAGRQIVFNVVDHIKKNRESVNRFVTLSPKTEMARKFHLGNGAIVLSENEGTDNYEYLNV